jgi:hypothetical protein
VRAGVSRLTNPERRELRGASNLQGHVEKICDDDFVEIDARLALIHSHGSATRAV